jgi:uncharacterized protein YndB with AHSA1/START domain
METRNDEPLPELVRREVVLPAPPEKVWTFLATDAGWADWWGAGSTIDARPDGPMHITYPDGRSAEGRVLEVEAPTRISFTWGFDRPDAPVPLDGSVVEITLTPCPEGTRLLLVHRLADSAARDAHEPGWRFQLGLFRGVVAARALGPSLVDTIDRWHAAWSVGATEGPTEPGSRRSALARVVHPDVVVEEPMASLRGLDDLDAWVAQVATHLAVSIRREGRPALCGDLATWAWVVVRAGAPDDGTAVAQGRSVARLGPDGRFRSVTGFWIDGPPGVPVSLVD